MLEFAEGAQVTLKGPAVLEVRFGPQGNVVEEFDAAPQTFLRVLAASLPAPEHELLATKDLVLWLSAGKRVQLGEAGRVAVWGDYLNQDNVDDDSAWQVNPEFRPSLVPDAIGGLPAVRFAGESYMITTPFSTTDNATIVSVFQFQPQTIDEGKSGELINFNGPPNLVIERWWEGHLKASMFAGWTAEDGITEGCHIRGNPIPEHHPVVAAFIYNHAENRSSLYVNGELIGEDKADQPAALLSPKVIGKNHLRGPNTDFFTGDIAEALVFNRSLDRNEIQDLSKHFLQTYGITNDSPAIPIAGLVP